MRYLLKQFFPLLLGAVIGVVSFFIVLHTATAQAPIQSQSQASALRAVPQSGGAGQYVTILGKSFGGAKGSVRFVQSAKAVDADVSFPGQCQEWWWRDTAIVVKVPGGAKQGQHTITVSSSDGKELGETSFTVTDAAPSPGVCGMAPDNGPATIPVTLYGERFGGAVGRVMFGNAPAEIEDGGWSAAAIRIKGAPSFGGPSTTVRVVTSEGTLSNPAFYTAGPCRAGQCGSGMSCCGDGSCRPSNVCAEARSACTYSWSFFTGRLGAIGDVCKAASECLSGVCTDGRCAAGEKGVGDQCFFDAECRSGLCANGQCAGVQKGIGAACASANECLSGRCVGNTCVPGSKKYGERCANGNECATLTCVNGACGQSARCLSVEKIEPLGNAIRQNSIFKVTFNQLVDEQTARDYVQVMPKIKGTYEFVTAGEGDSAKSEVLFRPALPLSQKLRYAVDIGNGVKASDSENTIGKCVDQGIGICNRPGEICTGAGSVCTNGAICMGDNSICIGSGTQCTGQNSTCVEGADCSKKNPSCQLKKADAGSGLLGWALNALGAVKSVLSSLMRFGTDDAYAINASIKPVLRVNLDGASAVLEWTYEGTDFDGFEVWRGDKSDAPFADVVKTTLSYTDSKISSGVTYSYKVRAYKIVITAEGPIKVYNEAPAAPTTLRITSTSTNQVNLAWDSADTNVDNFYIERSLNGSAFVRIPGVSISKDARTYADTGLTPFTRYWYRVRAQNAAGTSPYSNVVDTTTLDSNFCTDTIPVLPPTNVTATSNTSDGVVVGWQRAGTNEKAFELQRASGLSTQFIKVTGIPATTDTAYSYRDSNLTASTQYTYRAVAINCKAESSPSASASATTRGGGSDQATIPAAPTNFKADGITAAEISLSWTDNASNEATYLLERSGDGATFTGLRVLGPNTTSFVDQGLDRNTRYYYRLAAVNAAGTSAYAQTDATTNIVTVCFKLRPAAPVLSGATALSSNQIQLSWQDNSNNESSFIIERSPDGTTFQPIATPGTGTTSYIDPNLSSSTQYWYRIKAHNCKGDSDASNVMNATTQAGGGGGSDTTPRCGDGTLQLSRGEECDNGMLNGGLDNVCTASCTLRACGPNGECPSGSRCDARTNQCRPSCNTNADCQSPQVCDPVDKICRQPNITVCDQKTSCEPTDDCKLCEPICTNAPRCKVDPTPQDCKTLGKLTCQRADGSLFCDKPCPAGTETVCSENAWCSLTDDCQLCTACESADRCKEPPPNCKAQGKYECQRANGSKFCSDIECEQIGGEGDSCSGPDQCASGQCVGGRCTASLTIPAAPTNLKADGITAAEISLSWTDNASNEATYLLERSGDGATFTGLRVLGPNTTSFVDQGLDRNTRYYYRLAAVNAAGTSAYAQTDATTNIVTVCFKLRPAAPVLSGATALSSNQIQLSWQDNSNNESSFIIERSADGTTFQPIVTSGTGTTSYIDPNLSSSTQYWYRIKAHNCKGDSDASNVMNATTQAGGGGDTGTGGTGTGGTGTGGNGTGAGGTGSGGGAGTGAGTGTGTGGTGGGNNNIGEQCSLHSECKSGLCFNGKCDEDKDNDGLPRSVDPNDANADVDCDGLKDGQEDKNKNGKVDSDETNPVKSDTDEDGLLDSCDPFPLDKNRPAKSEHKKYLDQCPYAKKTTAWATQPLILALEALSHFVASLFSTTPAFAEEQETSKEFGAFSDPKSIELEGALSAFELFGWPDTKTPTINLWWTDDKNQNVEQYYIWRKTAGASGDPALVGSVSGTAEKKYSDQTGLAWGTEYVYVVKAKRGSAEGESNPKNITTASKLPDPSLPLGSVRIMRAGTEKSSDIFSNFGDAYKHTYEAQAIDTGGNVIQSGIVYTWNLTTQNSEEGSKQAKRAGVEGNLAKQDVTPLKNGSATLSVTASQSQFNVSKNATVSLMIDACNFSWESDASSAALVALDIKLSYCRGKGVAGDALPQLVARPVKIAPRKENYQFQEEYLFPLDGANLGKESNNARIKSDVIIMRVVKAKTYSAATWYADTYKRQPSQRALVNGYSAVQDATTGTYVNAYDTEGDSNTTGPTIYYFTTNTGAQGSTREILNKILERSIFSNGFGYDPSSIDSQGMKLRRDALRMIDAEAYRSAISRASRIPTLESGSFIKHQTISAWPSWQNELGRQLGISAPSDPYPNKDGALCQSGEEGNACKNTCTAQGYDKSTCWKADPNPANRAFGYSAVGERSAVETAIFSHGVRSYSYTYNQNDINKPMKSNFCMLLERLFTSGSHEYCISYQRSAQNMALLGTGAVCSDGAQCASDRCYTGKCADPLAYSTINNPPKIKSVTHDGNNLDGKTFKKTWDSEQKVEFIVTAEDTDGSIVQASATMTTTGVDNNPKTISLDDIEQIIYTQDNTQEPINEGKGKRAKYKMTVDINPANNVVPSGEYTMTIKVMDDFGSEVQRNINFRIDDRTANNPPTLSAPTISISSNSQSNATLMDKKIIVRNARDVSINIAVQASDPDTAQGDAINEVWYEFGNLNEKLNQGEGANYQKNDISLKDVDDGTHHTLLVRATDTRHGLFGTTNGITEMKLEEVVISTNTPPTFKRMQPVDGSKINKGAVLAITGTALDSDGIVEVRLYRKKGDDGAFESVNDPLVGTSTSLLFINFQEQTSDFDLANYTYKLVARDQYGMEGEYTFSVTTVVNGGWSEWGGCSKTCMTTSSDPGNQSRACNNPLPSTNGGAECARSADAIALANQPTTPGNRTETRPCSPPPPFCPIQGGWSKKWASISPDSQFDDNTGGTCSAACGGGWQKKTCDYPPPQHGGSECRREQNTMKEAYGQDASNTNTQPNQRDQYRKCNTGACPAWSYGVCSPTDSTAPSCGPGVQTATCTNATAQGTIDSAQSRCSSPDGAMGGQRTGLSCSLPACPDTDYDGVPDYKEPSTCVGLKGPENNDGCPLPKVTDMQKDRNLYWKGSTPAKVKIAWTSEHADSFDLYYSATPNGTRSQVYANLPANLTYDESSVYISIPEGDNSPRIWFYAKSSGSGIVFIGHHDINVTKPSIEIFPSIGKNEYLTCKKSNSSMTIDRSNTAISLSVRPLLGNYVDSLSVSNMNFNYKAGDGWWHFSTPNTDSQWFIVDATLNMLNGQVNHKQLAQFVSMPAGYSATCTQGGIAQSDLRDDCDGEWASIGIGRDEGEKWYNCSGNEEKLCRDLIRAGNCAGIGGSWCDATWRAVSCHKSTLPKPAGF